MRIDVHAHYFPQDYIDLLVSLGRTDLRHSGQSTDLSGRLAALDATRTDCQILSAVGLDHQLDDPDKAAAAARYINDAYKKVELEHKGRFRGFGWLPLPFVEQARAEALRCLDDLGFPGIAFPCFYLGRPLDDPEFAPVWEELDRRGAKAYIHPVGVHSASHPGMAQYGLHTAWGSPAQLGVTATRLVYSGLTQRYPNVKFIFAVCGGYLPYMWQRIERNLRRGLDDTATAAVGGNFFAWVKKLPLDPKDPMAEFRKFYYDSSVQDIPDALRMVRDNCGVGQILLGSDEIFASLVEAVEMIENSPDLSAEEKTAILDRNAQALFNFPPF